MARLNVMRCYASSLYRPMRSQLCNHLAVDKTMKASLVRVSLGMYIFDVKETNESRRNVPSQTTRNLISNDQEQEIHGR